MGIPKSYVGDKKDNRAQVNCLAFPDNISEMEEDANKQLNIISKIARKIGLRIANNKTKMMNTTREWATPEYPCKGRQVQILGQIYNGKKQEQ